MTFWPALLLALAPPPGGVVVRVVDGDTFCAWTGSAVARVRLLGVDCPEIHAYPRGVEPFGPEAAAYARGLLTGRVVRLEYDRHQTRDRRGRLVAYVWCGGRLVNLALVCDGYAWAWPYVPHAREHSFGLAEAEARLNRRGLWERVMRP